MRVIAGSAKSLRLIVPAGGIRPTSDAVREALFSMLGDAIYAGPFLDLYAGSGAVGIEGLSRGASRCVFVERDRRCVEAIRRNLGNTGLGEGAEVVVGDARRVVARVIAGSGPFGVIFADPPYADVRAVALVGGLAAAESLVPGGILVVQHSWRAALPGPEPDRVRRFGETALSFYSLPETGV